MVDRIMSRRLFKGRLNKSPNGIESVHPAILRAPLYRGESDSCYIIHSLCLGGSYNVSFICLSFKSRSKKDIGKHDMFDVAFDSAYFKRRFLLGRYFYRLTCFQSTVRI